jgi:hypothetical protein
MTFTHRLLAASLATLWFCCSLNAQQPVSPQGAIVPRLVNFSGKAADAQGKVMAGMAGATFAIYKDQYEGTPLWLETQNIQADARGNYTAQLGATKAEGLPLSLFTSGEARWLGVSVNGGAEQPRVLLLSVPYALKAADAETIGGLPPSAFVLAAPAHVSAASSSASDSNVPPPTVGGGGTLDFVPLWTPNGSTLGNSVLFQSGTPSEAKVGINLTAPVSTLDVNGSETIRGNLSLPAKGVATATGGKNSQPATFTASVFNSTTGTPVIQNFRWQAEPTGNNTSAASGSLNLLYGQGGNSISETGLQVGGNGRIRFAPGQTFPGVGSVTNVGLSAPASDFTVSGSPVSTSGTLALNWNVPPTNANTANAIVKRDATGSFQATFVQATNPSTAAGSVGIFGEDDAINTYGVLGSSTNGSGVAGFSPNGIAVYGSSFNGTAVLGLASGRYPGVEGWNAFATTPGADGVYGQSDGPQGFGVQGWGTDTVGIGVAGGNSLFGTVASGIIGSVRVGVLGDSTGYGVAATSDNSNALIAGNNGTADTLVVFANGGGAPIFAQGIGGSLFLDGSGNLTVSGAINAGTKDFRIDHPLDPANKYLYHASIESSEMKNMYDGVAVLDASGRATVDLPDWFEAVNGDFRYQLTAMRAPAPNLHIAQEVANNQFTIAGGQPGMKVSWQVTGVRHDGYARAHPLQVSVDKPESERGYYIHPELYGAPREKSLAAAHRAQVTQLAKAKEALQSREANPSRSPRHIPGYIAEKSSAKGEKQAQQ